MKRGFTLIEIMVATSIFLVVMTISMGAIYSVFDLSKKTAADKASMDNVELAVDTMSREMRFGKNYHCGASGTITAPQNCASGSDADGAQASFLSSDGAEIVYKQSGAQILRSADGGATFAAVTAPEVTVQSLTFYVFGAGTGDGLQPKALIKVKGYSESPNKASTRSDFAVETLVSQRLLDN